MIQEYDTMVPEVENSGISEIEDAISKADRLHLEKNYYNDALRVEQGEYIVTSLDKALGTHNIQQCIAVYVRDEDNNKHGLVHVDGHTDISSLSEFWSHFQSTNTIRIFGATSKTISGLNDSENNTKKIKAFFKSQDIDNIDGLWEDLGFDKDIIITQDNKVEIGLAKGVTTEGRILHMINDIRRKDYYAGIYPIIQGDDGTKQLIQLDERAIVKLKEYQKNPHKDDVIKNLPGVNTDDFALYDIAVKHILDIWQETQQHVYEKIVDINEALLNSEEKTQLEKIVAIMPLFIGTDAESKNDELLGKLQLDKCRSTKQLYDKLSQVSSKQQCTIADAVEVAVDYCNKIGESISKHILIQNCINEYKQQHGIKLDKKQIMKQQYGGFFSVDMFNNAVAKTSARIRTAMLLLSDNGMSIQNDTVHNYTILEATEAAKSLELLELMEEIEITHIQDIKNQYEQKQFNRDEILEEFKANTSQLSKRQKIQIERASFTNLNEFRDVVHQHAPDIVDVIVPQIERQLSEKHMQELEAKLSDNRYCVIQDEFLNQAKDKIPNFDRYTISKELARQTSPRKSMDLENNISSF